MYRENPCAPTTSLRPRGHVGSQRPGCVDVSETPRHVRDVLEQVLLEDESVVGLDLRAIDAEGHAAQCLQLQPRRGDDHVGVDVLTGLQRDAAGVDVIDLIGHHIDAALADEVVQVAIQDRAQPLPTGCTAA